MVSIFLLLLVDLVYYYVHTVQCQQHGENKMTTIPYSEFTPEIAARGCIVLDMPNEAYHAYDGLSTSGLKQFLISPAHYAFSEPTQRTRFMVIGEALHKALLEPELFAKSYMLLRDIEDRRKTEYKQAIKEFHEDL